MTDADEKLCTLDHYLSDPGGASARDLRIVKARTVRADNLLTEAAVALDGGNRTAARERVCRASEILRGRIGGDRNTEVQEIQALVRAADKLFSAYHMHSLFELPEGCDGAVVEVDANLLADLFAAIPLGRGFR